MSDLPDVHFGTVEDSTEDELPDVEDQDVDDDEELAETPSSVTAILGFDPKDLDSESPDDSNE